MITSRFSLPPRALLASGAELYLIGGISRREPRKQSALNCDILLALMNLPFEIQAIE